MAATTTIPDALKKLLDTKLDTLEKLELVLVLHATPTVAVQDAARELQIGPDVLRRVAREIQRARLITCDGDDVLCLAATPGEQELLATAAEIYHRDRHAIIEQLTTIAMNRLRSMAARSFANAFRIRKKGENDG